MRKHLLPIAAGLVALGFVLVLRLADPVPVQQVRQLVFDSYQRMNPRPYLPAGVRVVDIDEASLARFGQWPWPRSIIAEMVLALRDMGAAVVAFDMVFAEPDRTAPERLVETFGRAGLDEAARAALAVLPDPDEVFARAIAEAPVVTGFGPAGAPGPVPPRPAGFGFSGPAPTGALQGFAGATVNLPAFSAAAAGNGSFAIRNDFDTVLRRVPLFMRFGEEVYPSLAAEALRVGQGARTHLIRSVEDGRGGVAMLAAKIGRIEIPTTAAGEVLIHDSGPQPRRYVPAWRVLDPASQSRVRPEIEGHIVLVGTSAAGLLDIRATPLAPSVPGVSLHAQVLEQVILGHYLSRPDWATGLEVVGFLALGLTLVLIIPFVGALWSALIALVAVSAGFAGTWYAFESHLLLLDPVYPALAVLVIYLPMSASVFMQTEIEKRYVRSAFARYLSPELVNRLADNPDALRLGGENREITLLFSDIRSFTTISEHMAPADLVRFMNAYLTPMSEEILAQEGFIDKYIGDAIMAFWNAPLDVPDHAAKAFRAALGMRRALVALNARLAEERRAAGLAHEDIRIGIGINTGLCSVGNMGLEKRLNYSAMGDNVNLTSRLESETKTYGLDILSTEATVAAAGRGFEVLEIDKIRARGRRQSVRVFALLGTGEEIACPEFTRFRAAWREMIEAFRAGDWPQAEARRQACRALLAERDGWVPRTVPLDRLLDLYRARIDALAGTPPPPDWDGVFEAPEPPGKAA